MNLRIEASIARLRAKGFVRAMIARAQGNDVCTCYRSHACIATADAGISECECDCKHPDCVVMRECDGLVDLDPVTIARLVRALGI